MKAKIIEVKEGSVLVQFEAENAIEAIGVTAMRQGVESESHIAFTVDSSYDYSRKANVPKVTVGAWSVEAVEIMGPPRTPETL